ncbi:MAG: MoaD/ThiS family protein [Candidatus Krumholzibacteria bacterium]|nr:MoaD/ThiS family protein [Candidatus Krumholzibacteria bacterium]
MRIDVLLFARLRDVISADHLEFEVEEGTTVSQLAEKLMASRGDERVRGLPLRYAVDETFVPGDYRLRDGDSVALIPPVSGG